MRQQRKKKQEELLILDLESKINGLDAKLEKKEQDGSLTNERRHRISDEIIKLEVQYYNLTGRYYYFRDIVSP